MATKIYGFISAQMPSVENALMLLYDTEKKAFDLQVIHSSDQGLGIIARFGEGLPKLAEMTENLLKCGLPESSAVEPIVVQGVAGFNIYHAIEKMFYAGIPIDAMPGERDINCAWVSDRFDNAFFSTTDDAGDHIEVCYSRAQVRNLVTRLRRWTHPAYCATIEASLDTSALPETHDRPVLRIDGAVAMLFRNATSKIEVIKAILGNIH